jgi:hypothetical protein
MLFEDALEAILGGSVIMTKASYLAIAPGVEALS